MTNETQTSSVRERLLDAAERCLTRYGPQKTSMEDVARSAGMSRATVYRYFENRDALLLAVASRQAAALANESLGYLAEFDSISDWLVEGLLFTLREIPKRPVFASLVTSPESRVATSMFVGSRAMIEIGANVLRPMFVAAKTQGVLRDDLDLDLLIEWLLRVLWTYLNAPSPFATDEDSMRRLFEMMVVPAVLKDGTTRFRRDPT